MKSIGPDAWVRRSAQELLDPISHLAPKRCLLVFPPTPWQRFEGNETDTQKHKHKPYMVPPGTWIEQNMAPLLLLPPAAAAPSAPAFAV